MATLNGFSCCCVQYMQVPCVNFRKICTPPWDSCEDGPSSVMFYYQINWHCLTYLITCYRLAGLVVKVSALGAEDPGFESHLRWDFSGSSHTSDLKIGTPVATLPGAWRYRVSTGTGQPSVSMLWLGEVESVIFSFYLSLAAHKTLWADPSLRYTSMLLGRYATNKSLLVTGEVSHSHGHSQKRALKGCGISGKWLIFLCLSSFLSHSLFLFVCLSF